MNIKKTLFASLKMLSGVYAGVIDIFFSAFKLVQSQSAIASHWGSSLLQLDKEHRHASEEKTHLGRRKCRLENSLILWTFVKAKSAVSEANSNESFCLQLKAVGDGCQAWARLYWSPGPIFFWLEAWWLLFLAFEQVAGGRSVDKKIKGGEKACHFRIRFDLQYSDWNKGVKRLVWQVVENYCCSTCSLLVAFWALNLSLNSELLPALWLVSKSCSGTNNAWAGASQRRLSFLFKASLELTCCFSPPVRWGLLDFMSTPVLLLLLRLLRRSCQLPMAVFPTGPQPVRIYVRSEFLSGRMAESMAERMSESMSDRMSESMSERLSECMPDRMSECTSDRMLEFTSDRMPELMSDRMADFISDRRFEFMSDRMSKSKSEYVMVGISRSEVINGIEATIQLQKWKRREIDSKPFGWTCSVGILTPPNEKIVHQERTGLHHGELRSCKAETSPAALPQRFLAIGFEKHVEKHLIAIACSRMQLLYISKVWAVWHGPFLRDCKTLKLKKLARQTNPPEVLAKLCKVLNSILSTWNRHLDSVIQQIFGLTRVWLCSLSRTGGLLLAMAHFGAFGSWVVASSMRTWRAFILWAWVLRRLFGGEIDIRVVRGWRLEWSVSLQSRHLEDFGRIAYTKNKAKLFRWWISLGFGSFIRTSYFMEFCSACRQLFWRLPRKEACKAQDGKLRLGQRQSISYFGRSHVALLDFFWDLWVWVSALWCL